VVSVAPDVSGFVRELRVKDNQFVHKGDVLLLLDQDRYKLALATAAGNVVAPQADMLNKQHMAQRREKLTDLSTSVEERETAVFSSSTAVGTYQQAMANLGTARRNLDRTVIYAPVNGYVTNLTLDVGHYASVRTQVLALIDSDAFRIEGYFEETKIPGVHVGDQAKIYMMSGGPPLTGHVDSLSRGITDADNGNGPELLVKPAPTFEWVRLAQRIPVRIAIDDVPMGIHIGYGMHMV
jgi:RND family efflux transporter MFP subunit